MGIVKAGGDHLVAQIQHAGIGALKRLGPFGGAHIYDLVALHRHRAGEGIVAGGGKDGVAF